MRLSVCVSLLILVLIQTCRANVWFTDTPSAVREGGLYPLAWQADYDFAWCLLVYVSDDGYTYQVLTNSTTPFVTLLWQGGDEADSPLYFGIECSPPLETNHSAPFTLINDLSTEPATATSTATTAAGSTPLSVATTVASSSLTVSPSANSNPTTRSSQTSSSTAGIASSSSSSDSISNANELDNRTHTSLSPGGIGGIVIGSAGVLALSAIAVFMYQRRHIQPPPLRPTEKAQHNHHHRHAITPGIMSLSLCFGGGERKGIKVQQSDLAEAHTPSSPVPFPADDYAELPSQNKHESLPMLRNDDDEGFERGVQRNLRDIHELSNHHYTSP